MAALANFVEKSRAESVTRVKPSKAVLDLIKAQEKLARSGNYPEAQKCQKKVHELLRKDAASMQAMADEGAQKRVEVYKRQQRLEMEGLLARIERGRAPKRKGALACICEYRKRDARDHLYIYVRLEGIAPASPKAKPPAPPQQARRDTTGNHAGNASPGPCVYSRYDASLEIYCVRGHARCGGLTLSRGAERTRNAARLLRYWRLLHEPGLHECTTVPFCFTGFFSQL